MVQYSPADVTWGPWIEQADGPTCHGELRAATDAQGNFPVAVVVLDPAIDSPETREHTLGYYAEELAEAANLVPA